MLAMKGSKGSGGGGTAEGGPTVFARPTTNALPSAMMPHQGFAGTELDKLNDMTRSFGHHQSSLASMAGVLPPSNTRLLEHQILLLQQQEEANRLLLQRALFLRQQRQAGLTNQGGMNQGGMYNLAEEQKLQDEQSLRLRQMLGVPGARRGESRNKPSNNRASAA